MGNIIEFAIDLDSIDINFVYLILDILENFKLFKLCIFVCNRYKLNQRIGRYLVSVAHKYSDLVNQNSSISPSLLIEGNNRKAKLELAFISSQALHNVLENINPDYLKSKKEGEPLTPFNSLGEECYQGLLLLGNWKKILFQLDFHNALQLAYSFSDYYNYHYIYMTQSKSFAGQAQALQTMIKQNRMTFDLLAFQTPKSRTEIQLCISIFEFAVLQYLTRNKNVLVQNVFINKFFIYEQSREYAPIEKRVVFPEYFKYTAQILNFIG